MSWLDFTLIAGGTILAGTLIGWIRNSPVEGFISVMDLIIPYRDPQIRLMRFVATIVLPIAVGVGLGWFASEPLIVAGLACGLGAFFTVSAAFFRPDTLLADIRKRLLAAQLIYATFVTGYASLGVVGALLADIIKSNFDRSSLVNNLWANLVWVIVSVLINRILSYLANRFKSQADSGTETKRHAEFQSVKDVASARMTEPPS